jgi:Domain of unknown function (DUF4386)
VNTIKGSPRGTGRKTAIIVGVLYIIGTVAGILSVVFTGSILGDPDYLNKVSANQNQIVIGALLVLTMGLALAMVPVVIFPLLKKYNEVLALGYVVFRGALETVTYFVTAISWLLLVNLGQDYASAGTPNAPYFLTLGNLFLKAGEIGATMGAIVFPLGAIMLYVVFYQSKLIPRWLSIWGLIGVTLHLLATGLGGLFGLTGSMSTIQSVVALPIALQEMVMAVWLIVKGFDPSAFASGPAKTGLNQGNK